MWWRTPESVIFSRLWVKSPDITLCATDPVTKFNNTSLFFVIKNWNVVCSLNCYHVDIMPCHVAFVEQILILEMAVLCGLSRKWVACFIHHRPTATRQVWLAITPSLSWSEIRSVSVTWCTTWNFISCYYVIPVKYIGDVLHDLPIILQFY
jgi:hypothetical protein